MTSRKIDELERVNKRIQGDAKALRGKGKAMIEQGQEYIAKAERLEAVVREL